MVISETLMQTFCGTVPHVIGYGTHLTKSDPPFVSKPNQKCVQKGRLRCSKPLHRSTVQKGTINFRVIGGLYTSAAHHRSISLICCCQPAESVNGSTAVDGNGTWFVDDAKKLNKVSSVANGPNTLEFQDVEQLPEERKGTVSDWNISGETQRDALDKVIIDPIEEEAWELLRESMVYYCGSPVGTIAANDPTCSDALNYDQVFIRDFIPSGIAFLLKGEYDIVRNFILHTLQLQSWEKTMDCHSPGQGLMPASFKVRTVPLDGDDFATEEILDPDFGEAAIGRVAPVDSGLWWIILLRAYGKCSGDLSLQERVDVQTGIKMILRLCLADGFDMFPTLLVTDGSCMIDRRMGIHGHPLEIQNNPTYSPL